MIRSLRFAALAVSAMLLTGCAAATADPAAAPDPEPSHTMADGSVMTGAEHGDHVGGDQGTADHGAHEPTGDDAAGPSEAASMVCGGQVQSAAASLLGLAEAPAWQTGWQEPEFTCVYDVEGAPLVLTVHDASDPDVGAAHFEELQRSLPGAEEIEGMLGLGLPSFSTGEGMVAFLRDGKTLLVDATALPETIADGTMTQDEAAYAVASAVLVCWVEHD